MHYFNRNIGDYHKKAGRLSMLEHGAYTLLIDACYDREIFPTEEEAIDWCWARTDAEVAAVKFVLSKFFTVIEGRYVQNRIQEEIDEYHRKAKKNKEIAIERERKRREDKARIEHDSCSSGDESSPNQEPITNNQEPQTKNHDSVDLSQATPQAKPAAKNAYPDWFEEIWSVYPTRSGGNDKRKALQAANARLKQGRTKQELLEAVKRYRYFVVATGKVSTEYVKMAASFFGPNNDNLDNPWTPPPSGGGGGRTPPKFDPLAYVNRFQSPQGNVIDVTPVNEPVLIGTDVGGEHD